jgi:hypothetical protein
MPQPHQPGQPAQPAPLPVPTDQPHAPQSQTARQRYPPGGPQPVPPLPLQTRPSSPLPPAWPARQRPRHLRRPTQPAATALRHPPQQRQHHTTQHHQPMYAHPGHVHPPPFCSILHLKSQLRVFFCSGKFTQFRTLAQLFLYGTTSPGFGLFTKQFPPFCLPVCPQRVTLPSIIPARGYSDRICLPLYIYFLP